MNKRKYIYFSDRFRSINEDAIDALAKGYLIRHESWEDKRWIEAYKLWLLATKSEFDDEGIDKFRTMDCFYFERVKSNRGNYYKKDWVNRAAEREIGRFTHGINS